MAPSSSRHAPGAGSRVTAPERRQIQQAHLIEGLHRSALAQRFGRTRETIAAQLRGDDFDQLRAEIERAECEDAIAVLNRRRVVAAQAWGSAIETAASKGNHRPAKDLLVHTRVIEPVSAIAHRQTQPTIVIGIAVIPGLPERHPVPNDDDVVARLLCKGCRQTRSRRS